MNLKDEILREHSKRQALRITSWVGSDRRRFARLMDLFLHGKYRVTQRSAWVVSLCAEKHPWLIHPHLRRMIRKTQEPGVHDAVKRNVVRILQFIDVPADLLGEVATVCFDFLAAPREPIAVRVFSMTVLSHIARKEPDLKNELRLLIGQQLEHHVSPGFRSRAQKVMKVLE